MAYHRHGRTRYTLRYRDAMRARDGAQVALQQLFAEGHGFDLIIRCKDRRFLVHRAIICSQSKPFSNHLSNAVDEPGKPTVLHLPLHLLSSSDNDFDEPHIMEAIFQIMYGQAAYHIGRDCQHDSAVLTGAKLAKMAKKYGVHHVAESGIGIVESCIFENEWFKGDGEEISGLARYIYLRSDVKDLRDLICNFLLANPEILGSEEVKEVLEEFPEFAMCMMSLQI